MKTIYKCENCGMEFNNFNSCAMHEKYHVKEGDWIAVYDEYGELMGVGRLVRHEQAEDDEPARVHIDELDVSALPIPTYHRGYYTMSDGYYIEALPADFEKFPELIGNMFADITDTLKPSEEPVCDITATYEGNVPHVRCTITFAMPTKNNS